MQNEKTGAAEAQDCVGGGELRCSRLGRFAVACFPLMTMKRFLLGLLVCCFAVSHAAFADSSSGNGDENGDDVAVRSCLKHWGKKQPFGNELPAYKTLSSKVKILGIGKDISDEKETAAPALLLIKPNVNVLSKSTMTLMNPNGWYCIKGQVTVLGKADINLHCKANLASSHDGATVLGGSDHDGSGREGAVTVLGASRINRMGCEKGSADSAAKQE